MSQSTPVACCDLYTQHSAKRDFVSRDSHTQIVSRLFSCTSQLKPQNRSVHHGSRRGVAWPARSVVTEAVENLASHGAPCVRKRSQSKTWNAGPPTNQTLSRDLVEFEGHPVATGRPSVHVARVGQRALAVCVSRCLGTMLRRRGWCAETEPRRQRRRSPRPVSVLLLEATVAAGEKSTGARCRSSFLDGHLRPKTSFLGDADLDDASLALHQRGMYASSERREGGCLEASQLIRHQPRQK